MERLPISCRAGWPCYFNAVKLIRGNFRAEVGPLATLAGFAHRAFCKSTAQCGKPLRVKIESVLRGKRLAEKFARSLHGKLVAYPDTSVVAMAIALGAPAEQGRTDVIRAIDPTNIFSPAQPPGNRIVVFHESRAVALADISQHAKKMMAAQTYGQRFGAAALRIAAPRADLMRPPMRKGATPRAIAFSKPMMLESQTAPRARQITLAIRNETNARPTRLPF